MKCTLSRIVVRVAPANGAIYLGLLFGRGPGGQQTIASVCADQDGIGEEQDERDEAI